MIGMNLKSRFLIFSWDTILAYLRRALQNHRTSLLAALIQPFEEKAAPLFQPIPCSATDLNTAHSYALYWGSPEKLHSFVIHPSNATCAIANTGNGAEIVVSFFSSSIPDGQDAIELSFFASLSSTPNIKIQNSRATTFQLGDTIALNSDAIGLKLQVVLEKGQGRFFGHILRANRPLLRRGNN